MSTGLRFGKLAGVSILCVVVLCGGNLIPANAATARTQHRTKKPQLPPLPSGPQGPVPQIPLDSMAPVPPQVTYEHGQLTIIASNSTLGDILRAVRKETGADIEIPVATDRVVTHLGPGPAREVMADLLNGSRFNYVLLGSPENASLLTRVVLVVKANTPGATPNNPPGPQPMTTQAGMVAAPPPDDAQDAADATDATDDTTDDSNNNVDQAADTDQPVASPDQPGMKTPQQMLQEMQQRQLQMQQQQQQQNVPGQPIPGARPPQDQDQ